MRDLSLHITDDSPICPYCEKQIGIGASALAVRAGCIKRVNTRFVKHTNYYDTFEPSSFDDGTPVKWFHMTCLEMLFDLENANITDGTDCGFCPEDLLGEPKCYELELGDFQIRDGDTWWVEEKDGKDYIRTLMCAECMEMGIGEGNMALMRHRLGKAPDEMDNKLWIKQDEINMLGS